MLVCCNACGYVILIACVCHGGLLELLRWFAVTLALVVLVAAMLMHVAFLCGNARVCRADVLRLCFPAVSRVASDYLIHSFSFEAATNKGQPKPCYTDGGHY